MLTLTTKQMREDMSQVISALEQGTPIQLTYRHKVVGTIEPAQKQPTKLRRGSAEAVIAAFHGVDFGVSEQLRNDPRSTKEILNDLRDHDPKYQ